MTLNQTDHALELLAEAPLLADPLRADPVEDGAKLLLIECGAGELAVRFSDRFGEVYQQNSLYPEHLQALALGQPQANFGDVGDSVEPLKSVPNPKAPKKSVHFLLGDVPRAWPLPSSSTTATNEPRNGETEQGFIHFPPESFDAVLFRLSKGTAQLDAALRESFHLLKPNGQLWVAGHNQEGIKSFAKRGEALFGNINVARIKHSCRLLGFIKTATQAKADFAEQVAAEDDYFSFRSLECPLPDGKVLQYLTKPGIFSYRSTDPGTSLLIRYLPALRDKSVLDLCSGSGVISLAALALGAQSVLAVDANAIAVACAKLNFQAFPSQARAICSQLVDQVEESFDIVIANPPFHQGHQTDYSLPKKVIAAIASKLNPGGTAWLVANQFLDYPMVAREHFATCETVCREKGYRVFRLSRDPLINS